MLRSVAGQNYRVIVEGGADRRVPAHLHGLTLTRMARYTALAGDVCDHDPRLRIRLRTDRPNPGLTREEPTMATSTPYR
jgi:hypothetical protein